MSSLTFTRKKFLKLKSYQQHKKCAELLRSAYDLILVDKKPSFETYHSYLQWMQLPLYSSSDRKKIADRYHWHLEQGSINLKEHNLLPQIRKNDGKAKEEYPNCAIYLDNIRSAYNVGSILRTTEALRIGSVHFAKKTPFIDNLKVKKIAMGTSDLVPCYRDTDLKTLPKPIIAIDTSDDAISIDDSIFPTTFTLVLGNEEYGVSNEALKIADYLIEIPLCGIKNSINVACAFSSIATEIRRQKKAFSL